LQMPGCTSPHGSQHAIERFFALRIIEAARPCNARHGRVLALARGIPAYTGPAGDASDRKAWATAARSRLLRTSDLLTHATLTRAEGPATCSNMHHMQLLMGPT